MLLSSHANLTLSLVFYALLIELEPVLKVTNFAKDDVESP
jgi:hypothetical protein